MNKFLLALGLMLLLCSWGQAQSKTQEDRRKMAKDRVFDWQGHRGARGLAPENTVPAFLRALEFPEIGTLELDLAVSADEQLVVSHEPWLSSAICAHPDGSAVLPEEEENLLIFKHAYLEIQEFDCGTRGNPRFPEQEAQSAHKPTLDVVVKAVEEFCESTGREIPLFNIEIKSQPEWDGIKTPAPERFAQLVADKLRELELEERACIQSFDPRSLRAMRAIAPHITLALLVENLKGLETNVASLGFVPSIYSPYYKLVRPSTVKKAHQMNMKIIPWTVNETAQMKRLQAMGVDGIITDYPNRIPRD